MSNSAILLQKYDLAAVPESVVRLGKLVMNRDANIDAIIKLISMDDGLKTRLLRAANPRDGYVTIKSIQEAVFRTGVGCLIMCPKKYWRPMTARWSA